MNGKVPKIGEKIKHVESAPLFSYIRNFLLKVKREPITPPPGPPTPDGQAVYRTHGRYADDQSSRNTEPALAQGGVAHKIAGNYYYERDARRMVIPPTPLYKIDEKGQLELRKASGETIPFEQFNEAVAINFGPEQNYGFNPKVPTPGFGYEWTRSIGNEELTQQRNAELTKVQKFDKYMKS